MSSYHSAFKYLEKHSYDDFKWHIVHIDNADHGETDTFLATESISTSMYDGTKNLLYGTKYSSNATLQITVMKNDGTDFTLSDTRNALRWLTGAKQNSWLDLYIGDEVKYRMLGHVQDTKLYKMDARVVGLTIIFESASPYAYSAPQRVEDQFSGQKTIILQNDSDDLYAYTYVHTKYTNSSGDSLKITNETTGEITSVTGIKINEEITISDNLMIVSDDKTHTFGSSFNYVFPRLSAGDNQLTLEGNGSIVFEYIYPIKVADAIGELNAVSDPICDDEGHIILDTLSWERISDKPSTLGGYGITNAYTKSEIDAKLSNVVLGDVYTKAEIDSMLENVVVDDVYTKTEIDEKLANITTSGVDINEEELNAMLEEVLG